jgi:hypothetical protein
MREGKPWGFMMRSGNRPCSVNGMSSCGVVRTRAVICLNIGVRIPLYDFVLVQCSTNRHQRCSEQPQEGLYSTGRWQSAAESSHELLEQETQQPQDAPEVR